jgi:rhodanese-related sulfurtransferase
MGQMKYPMDDAELERAQDAVRRVSAAEARALANAGRAVLVDIRDRSGYDNTHIEGARSLPLAVLDATAGDLPADALPPRDRLVVAYCA